MIDIKQNKHNGVHTIQNGNSEFKIISLLPTGKQNAISTRELVVLTGCSSARELQQYIAIERSRGAVIYSSTTGGYFLLANHGEIAEFCKSLESRAKNTFLALRSAKRCLNVPEEQEAFVDEVMDHEK